MNFMSKLIRFSSIIILLLLSGCVDLAKVNVSKKEAIDEFVARSDKITEDFSNTQLPPAPPRSLVQFTYGPTSLRNFEFLEYLVDSKANLSSDIIKQLKEEENNYLLSADFDNSGSYKISKRLEQYKKDLKIYKKLSELTFVTFNNRSLENGLTELANRAELQVFFPEESQVSEKPQLRGQFNGSLLEVIEKIANDAKLKVSFKSDMKTIVFSKEPIQGNIRLSAEKIKDTFLVRDDAQKINDIMTKISKKNDELTDDEINLFVYELESKSAQNFIRSLLFQVNQEQILKKKNADLSHLRKSIIGFSEAAPKDMIKTVATFNPNLKNGSERVIEKFNVFNDSPDSMFKLLNNYSVFKEKCVQKQDKNGNVLPGNSPKPITQNQNNTNASTSNTNQNNSQLQSQGALSTAQINANQNNTQLQSQANFNQPQVSTNQNIQIVDSNKNLNLINDPSKTQQTSDTNKKDEILLTESDPSFVSAELTGCVVFSKDSSGVLVAGTVVEAELAARFISDQDKPVKQALLEVYIMEVTKNWQSKIQSNLDSNH